jgi:hypothetical protein
MRTVRFRGGDVTPQCPWRRRSEAPGRGTRPGSRTTRAKFAEADPAKVNEFYRAIELRLVYDPRNGSLVAELAVGPGRGSIELGPVVRRRPGGQPKELR